jgi:hypothetical protein
MKTVKINESVLFEMKKEPVIVTNTGTTVELNRGSLHIMVRSTYDDIAERILKLNRVIDVINEMRELSESTPVAFLDKLEKAIK